LHGHILLPRHASMDDFERAWSVEIAEKAKQWREDVDRYVDMMPKVLDEYERVKTLKDATNA
jgi:hypothetical protein